MIKYLFLLPVPPLQGHGEQVKGCLRCQRVLNVHLKDTKNPNSQEQQKANSDSSVLTVSRCKKPPNPPKNPSDFNIASSLPLSYMVCKQEAHTEVFYNLNVKLMSEGKESRQSMPAHCWKERSAHDPCSKTTQLFSTLTVLTDI